MLSLVPGFRIVRVIVAVSEAAILTLDTMIHD